MACSDAEERLGELSKGLACCLTRRCSRQLARVGEKLAIVSWEKDGEVCCISLVKADELTGMVKGLLGPMMEGIIAS